MLTDEGSKWIYDNSGNFTSPGAYMAYMKFDVDSCASYYLDSGKAIRHDPSYWGAWSYSQKDSVLDILGHKIKVTGIAGDTIYLADPENNSKSVLVRFRE